MQNWFLVNGRPIRLKEGIGILEIRVKYPDKEWKGPFRKAPSIRTMEKWSYDGIARAMDGCKVEPDGKCPHDTPSWMMVLGII